MSVWEAKGKTFLITGGASGLGARYLHLFMDQGAKSIAILDIAEQQGIDLAEKYDKTHPRQVTFIKCDMSKEDEITKAFEEVLAKFKQIDVIINNAGIMIDAPAVWRKATDVNVQGLISLTLKGVTHMDKREGGAGGTIINISSTAALTPLPFIPVYSGAKSAVMHFCRSLAMDPFYEDTGVRILCMCFGPTDTPLLHDLEKRAYHPKMGLIFAEAVPENGFIYQKIDSAIASVDYMIKHGDNGSIWLSRDDKPAKDITEVIKQAYRIIEKEFMDV